MHGWIVLDNKVYECELRLIDKEEWDGDAYVSSCADKSWNGTQWNSKIWSVTWDMACQHASDIQTERMAYLQRRIRDEHPVEHKAMQAGVVPPGWIAHDLGSQFRYLLDEVETAKTLLKQFRTDGPRTVRFKDSL